MSATLAAQTWRCDEAVATRWQGECRCADGWSAGKCRICTRLNDDFGHKIGVMGGVYLENGVCPNCGTEPPPVEICHACGGSASTRDYGEALGKWEKGPELVEESTILDLAVHMLELEPTEGRLPRHELDRLMTKLYGRKFSRRLEFVRGSWRFLLGEYLGGLKVGQELAISEAHDKAAEGTS